MEKIIAIIFIFFSVTLLPASAGPGMTYTATLTGSACANCNNCKQTIAQSLGKIKGVKTIKIKKTSDNSHRLTVITDGSNAISKRDATKALGKEAKTYRFTSWNSSGHSH